MNDTERVVRVVNCTALPATLSLAALAPRQMPGQLDLLEALTAFAAEPKTTPPIALAAKDLATGTVRHFRLRPYKLHQHPTKATVVVIDEAQCDETDEDGKTLREEVSCTGWLTTQAHDPETFIGEITIAN